MIRMILSTPGNEKGANALAWLPSVFGTWRHRGDAPSMYRYTVLSPGFAARY